MMNHIINNKEEYMKIIKILYNVNNINQLRFKDNDIYNLQKENIIIVNHLQS